MKANDTGIQRDNQLALHFFSTHLDILGEDSITSRSIAENFRIIASSPEIATGSSLMDALSQEDAIVLHLLALRYDHYGLFGNLLRIFARDQLAKQITSLCSIASTLVEKSKLLFNRSYYTGGPRSPGSPVLHSTALTLLAESCTEVLVSLEKQHLLCHKMNGSSFAQVDNLVLSEDERIAQSLGFTEIDYSKTSEDRQSSFPGAYDCLPFLDRLERYLEDATSSDRYEDLASIFDVVQRLRFAHLQLQALDFPKLKYFEGFNKVRVAFSAGLASMTIAWAELDRQLTGFMQNFGKGYQPQWPAAVRARLQYEFCRRGEQLAASEAMCQALIDYCVHYQLCPAEVIDQEAARVHSRLQPSDISLFKSLYRERTPLVDTTCRTMERQSSLDRIRRVQSRVSSLRDLLAGSGALLLALLFMLPGCGFKTNPISDVLDKQPAIPFRSVTQSTVPVLEKK